MSVAELMAVVSSAPVWVWVVPVVVMLIAATSVRKPSKDGGYDSRISRRG